MERNGRFARCSMHTAHFLPSNVKDTAEYSAIRMDVHVQNFKDARCHEMEI